MLSRAFTAGLLTSLPLGVAASSLGCDYRDECLGIHTPWYAVAALIVVGTVLAWRESDPKALFPPLLLGGFLAAICLGLAYLVS